MQSRPARIAGIHFCWISVGRFIPTLWHCFASQLFSPKEEKVHSVLSAIAVKSCSLRLLGIGYKDSTMISRPFQWIVQRISRYETPLYETSRLKPHAQLVGLDFTKGIKSQFEERYFKVLVRPIKAFLNQIIIPKSKTIFIGKRAKPKWAVILRVQNLLQLFLVM